MRLKLTRTSDRSSPQVTMLKRSPSLPDCRPLRRLPGLRQTGSEGELSTEKTDPVNPFIRNGLCDLGVSVRQSISDPQIPPTRRITRTGDSGNCEWCRNPRECLQL